MILFGDQAKLRTYTASSRAGKHVLKIEIEYPDPSHMGYEMSKLDEELARQNEPRPGSRKKPLALPKPDAQR